MRWFTMMGTFVCLIVALISFPGLAIHEGVAAPEAISNGNLGSFKYLNRFELDRLGFTGQDLDNVKYVSDLDLSLLASGGPPPDAIPSIDEPRFVSVAETDTWLEDDELVLGIRFNDIVRAYPLAILNWHEIVNDDFGGTKVVVTYCPLCDSGLAFLAPQIDGQIVEFGTSGRLFRSDLVMYDRVTGTFWEQFQGRPIVGPLVGEAGFLHRIPIDIVPYGLWKSENPETEMLARPVGGDRLGNQVSTRASTLGEFLRNYNRDPYSRYRVTNPGAGGRTSFGVPFNDDRLDAKDNVIGIAISGQAKAYARNTILEQQLLNDELAEVPLLVIVTPASQIKFFERIVPDSDTVLEFSLEDEILTDDQGNNWNFDGLAISGPLAGTQLIERVGTPSFWFAWVSFNPDTELFGGNEE